MSYTLLCIYYAKMKYSVICHSGKNIHGGLICSNISSAITRSKKGTGVLR